MSLPNDWPFDDPPNVAVFTVRSIVEGGLPILLVTHDEDDGAWQFHDGSDQPRDEDAMIVGLREMLDHDATIAELADLPYGWIAWRAAPDQPWQRQVQPWDDESE